MHCFVLTFLGNTYQFCQGNAQQQNSSVQPLDRLGRRRDTRDHSTEIPLEPFLRVAICEQFWHGQGRTLFDAVHQTFPQPTKASPALQSDLKDGFGEAVVACDMPEQRRFPSVGSYQQRFHWIHTLLWLEKATAQTEIRTSSLSVPGLKSLNHSHVDFNMRTA